MNLAALAQLVRNHPGLRAKRDLQIVARTLGGDGDDAAVIETQDPEGHLVLAAEAIAPEFVAADPRAAGIAGVVTCLNDLAATGARPVALLDCVVSGSPEVAAAILDGLRAGAAVHGVPVVGGHTTLDALASPSLASFAIGRARAPLRAAAAKPGDALCLAVCIEGELVRGAAGPFFSHLRGPRRRRAAADLALLADAAEAGEAWAGRDVSQPGVAGSLVQMCESAGGLGCALDLDALPVPEGVAMEDWLLCFPSYAFLLAGDPDALGRRFAAAGLTCVRVGAFDASGAVRLTAGGEQETIWDLGAEPLAGLRPPSR